MCSETINFNNPARLSLVSIDLFIILSIVGDCGWFLFDSLTNNFGAIGTLDTVDESNGFSKSGGAIGILLLLTRLGDLSDTFDITLVLPKSGGATGITLFIILSLLLPLNLPSGALTEYILDNLSCNSCDIFNFFILSSDNIYISYGLYMY